MTKSQTSTSRSPLTAALLLLSALAMTLASTAHAGLFGVTPIRVDLDRENRTGSFAVSNDDPDKALQMQASLMEWTQDANGKDIYTPSNDLVFFPQIFAVEKGEQRVVRVGIKAPATTVEKSYRLFVEELPPPRDPNQTGAQIQFVLRFGVPIFVRPEKDQLAGSIEHAEAGPGTVTVLVRNGGNESFQIQSIVLKGADGYSKELVGGYALAGVAKAVEFEMPLDACKKSSRLEVSMKTDRLGNMARTLDLDTSHCSAK